MKIRFWGTRGSIAAPGADTAHFGGNTSCVSVTLASGEVIVLDCGTGARALGARLMDEHATPFRASIVLGHTHWDHIQGFPFFAPVFSPGNHFELYAPEGGMRSIQETLAGQMEYAYFPVSLHQLPCTLRYHELTEGVCDIGGARVSAAYLNHPGVTLGYRIEADGAALVYLTDHEPFSARLWRSDEFGPALAILHPGDRRHAAFMAGADLVIHDAQYTPAEFPAKQSWGHSGFDYAVDLACCARVRRLALTHHDPARLDAAVAVIEAAAEERARRRGAAMEVFCAWEGCEIELAGA